MNRGATGWRCCRKGAPRGNAGRAAGLGCPAVSLSILHSVWSYRPGISARIVGITGLMHLVDEIYSGLFHGYRRFLPASVCEGPILLVLHIRELDKNDAA